MPTPVLAVAHLGLISVWLGSMLYSLLIVQPRVTQFLAGDDDQLEALLTTLGAGNRRPVLALIAGIEVSGGLLVAVSGPSAAQLSLYLVALVLVGAAGALFVRVSWQLWPSRIFALPAERPAHRAVLRRYAMMMTGLLATSFTLAVAALAAE